VVLEGTVRIKPIRHFEDAGLHPVMLENVKLSGYNVPTPVQAYCLPAIAEGYDVIACAQTGYNQIPETSCRADSVVQVLAKLQLSSFPPCQS
jgi:hypothetical protein